MSASSISKFLRAEIVRGCGQERFLIDNHLRRKVSRHFDAYTHIIRGLSLIWFKFLMNMRVIEGRNYSEEDVEEIKLKMVKATN